MKEILPGVLCWNSFHEAIQAYVHSYYIDATDPPVLIDPRVPAQGLEWFAARRAPQHIYLTNRHHYRHSGRFAERFELQAWCHKDGLHEFTYGEKVKKLEEYAKRVKRDLIDAAKYLDRKGGEMKGLLGFDVTLLKQEFCERFRQAADQTTTALYELQQQAESAEYHSVELVGPGTLDCDQCGEKLHFHKPGRIPIAPSTIMRTVIGSIVLYSDHR